MLELYQSEACPHSAKVRDRLSELGVSIFLRGENPVVYDRSESDNPDADYCR